MEGEQDTNTREKNSTLINRKRVKEFLLGYHVSSDVYPELESLIEETLNKAMIRAAGGRRRTILARDL